MKKLLLLLPATLAGVLAVPLLAVLALAGATSAAVACDQPAPSPSPSASAVGLLHGGQSAQPAGSSATSAGAIPAASSSPLSVHGCTELVPPGGDLAQRALAWALAHVGDAYVAAAHGPHAWDCSTFTYTAYKQAGLDWPMQISYQQYLDRRHIQLIPLAQAQPGDLLFFDTNSGNSWYNPVTHVAMIIDPVAGTMVHAANSRYGVTISNYKTSTYYRTHPPVTAPDGRGTPQAVAPSVAGRIMG